MSDLHQVLGAKAMSVGDRMAFITTRDYTVAIVQHDDGSFWRVTKSVEGKVVIQNIPASMIIECIRKMNANALEMSSN